MIQFRQAACLLFGKNVINVSKRSLFSDRFTFLEGFRRKRLTTQAKSEIEFMHEIQNATIPKLLDSTKQWTLATSSTPAHIKLLHQSLYRLHDNCAAIQTSQDVEQFNQLGQMTMRLFDHFELPEKALQVNKINRTFFFRSLLRFKQFYNNTFSAISQLHHAQFYYKFDNCFFDSASTSFVLMNLLFKQKRYDDVLKVYRIRTVERQRGTTMLHKTLVYAACYKLVSVVINI